MNDVPSARLPPVAWVYLGLSIVGAGSTWTYNTLWMLSVERAITLQEFLRVGFEGTWLLGSLAADFWVGSFAALIWMVVEARRLRMRRLWVYVLLTFAVAWAFSFPLFLFMRERKRISRDQPCDGAGMVRASAVAPVHASPTRG